VTSRRREKVLALLLVALLLQGGCSLFEPRKAEEPGGGEQVPWDPPTSMAVALRNIERALEAKSLTNYDRSLAQTFVFEPDPVDVSEIGSNPFEDWDREQEVATMSQILATSAEISLEWTVRDSVIVSVSEAYYEDLGYRLVFSWGDRDTIFSGNADLYFVEDNNQWFLSRWVDKRDGSGHLTWGRLRNQGSLPE
jgi:hypothetical protein